MKRKQYSPFLSIVTNSPSFSHNHSFVWCVVSKTVTIVQRKRTSYPNIHRWNLGIFSIHFWLIDCLIVLWILWNFLIFYQIETFQTRAFDGVFLSLLSYNAKHWNSRSVRVFTTHTFLQSFSNRFGAHSTISQFPSFPLSATPLNIHLSANVTHFSNHRKPLTISIAKC